MTDGVGVNAPVDASPVTGPAKTSLAEVARGSSANLFGAVVTSVGQFALTIIVARAVSRADAGVFFSATSLFLLAITIGQLGTATGLVYFIARCRTLNTPELIAGYLRVALRPVVVTAFAMAIGMFVFAPQLAQLTIPGHADSATTYLRILALFIPFAGVENVALAATRGLGTMKPNALVEQVVRPIAQLVLVAGVAGAAGASSRGLLGWAWALGYAPTGVWAWLWWRRLSAARGFTERPADRLALKGLRRQFWLFTSPRALSSVVQIAMQRLDIVLVGALSGAVNAAIYAAATRFVVAGQMGQSAISLAAQPRLAQAIAEDDHAGANYIYQTSTAWLMAVTWPLYLVFTVFGGSLLRVFGHGYGAGTAVLFLLSLSMLVATGCGMVDMVLSMAGHTSWNLYNVVLAFGIQLGLDIWLIPHHGVLGAAIGWGTAIAVKNLVALTQIAVVMRLHPLGRSTVTAGALCLICFAAIPLASRLALGTGFVSVIGGSCVGGVIFLGLAWKMRDSLQLQALRALRPRQRRPAGKV